MNFRDDFAHHLKSLFLSPRGLSFSALSSTESRCLLFHKPPCSAMPSQASSFFTKKRWNPLKKPGTLVTKYCFHPINQSLIKRWDAWGSRGGNAVFLSVPEWQRRWGKTPGRDGIESAYVRPLRGRGNSSSRTSRAHKFAMTS